MRTSELLVVEEAPVKSASPQKTNANANASDVVILHNHIRALHKQLTISHNDLVRLGSFLNQPLLDEPMVRSYFAKTPYITARQNIAIEYVNKTLQSISDVVTIVGTHISGAEIRLQLLWDEFGNNTYPITKNSLNRLDELMEECWGLHGRIKGTIDRVLLGRRLY